MSNITSEKELFRCPVNASHANRSMLRCNSVRPIKNNNHAPPFLVFSYWPSVGVVTDWCFFMKFHSTDLISWPTVGSTPQLMTSMRENSGKQNKQPLRFTSRDFFFYRPYVTTPTSKSKQQKRLFIWLLSCFTSYLNESLIIFHF